MKNKSCAQCKFLYFHDGGYSNYTVEETNVECALGKNPNLPDLRPYDWDREGRKDNWPKTNKSACERYAKGSQVHLDVDGEDGPADSTDDEEVIEAVVAHSGRPRHGRYPR